MHDLIVANEEKIARTFLIVVIHCYIHCYRKGECELIRNKAAVVSLLFVYCKKRCSILIVYYID